MIVRRMIDLPGVGNDSAHKDCDRGAWLPQVDGGRRGRILFPGDE